MGCRIPGVLAVDVCKGFAVTTTCPSCEKMQSSKFCSSRAGVKHVVGKARYPKNYQKTKYIFSQTRDLFERAVGGRVVKQTKTKRYLKEKVCGKEKLIKNIRNPKSVAFLHLFWVMFDSKNSNEIL